jgi:hypothetical protein
MVTFNDEAVEIEMGPEDVELKEVQLESRDKDNYPEKKIGCLSNLWGKIRPEVLCPSQNFLLQIALAIAGTALAFGATISLLGHPALPPDGNIFQLGFLLLVASFAGFLVCVYLPFFLFLKLMVMLRFAG